ncbi:tetratricopeptide repeat protein [Dactylosporangium sp. NBC_01737]|uniref:ATP-binding protein n=1 Tax=Dactylosporangium sp. NBC_01737 TaxID=2975959 RepID=UPI002E162674|nr:tetratricopeptide repeat protein [Dactylosporangium sp. NBC_01737]
MRHRRATGWTAAAVAGGGLAWMAALRTGRGLHVGHWLDRGDQLASITGAVMTAASLVVAYLAWRHPGRGTSATGPGARPRPAQLPLDAAAFTGRAAELEALLASAAGVIAIDGMGGIGKTALAVRAAHRMAGRYPDGQLFIDLKGFTDQEDPVEPIDAVGRLLNDLDVPAEQVPADLAGRIGLWRSVLAGRRLLIVLDNAAAAEQVAPLLPGHTGCLVLVTSRRRLAGLPTTSAIPLGTLPAEDAADMFLRIVRPGASALPADDVTEVVALCARLPLAIGIAAGVLRSHPAWSVADVVARLRDQQERLAELDDGTRSVRVALETSYRHLAADLQDLYRLLGRHPGPDIDAFVAAALSGTLPGPARRMLDRLFDERLLLEPSAGRYVFHDLVREHAAGVGATEPEPAGRAADVRLLDYFRHTARVAVGVAYPDERDDLPDVPAPATAAPDLADQSRATVWLDRELANLLALANSAGPEHTPHLTTILLRHLQVRRRYRDALALLGRALMLARDGGDAAAEMRTHNDIGRTHLGQWTNEEAGDAFERALDIARTIGDRRGELAALHGRGVIRGRQRNPDQGRDDIEQAVEIAREVGDRRGEMASLDVLGEIHRLQGRYVTSSTLHRQALDLARAVGDRHGERITLGNLGQNSTLQGRYDEAGAFFQQALDLARAVGDRHGETYPLNGLAAARQSQGRYEEAGHLHRQSLDIARGLGYRNGEMAALIGLGELHRRQGRHRPAGAFFQQALDIAQAMHDRNGRFEAHLGLGRVHRAAGRLESALEHHREALNLAEALGFPGDQARAHDGLAHTLRALRRPDRAGEHWRQALEILTSSDVEQFLDAETTAAAIRMQLRG